MAPTNNNRMPPPFLARLYPMPHPYLTEDDWYRYQHRDLAAMDATELRREGRRTQLRLDYEYDRHDRAWLTERLAAIRKVYEERERTRASLTTTPAPRSEVRL